MASPTPVHSNGEFSQGLPPVTPPSGKFIAQLFLVPGLIVAFVLLIFIGLGWLSSQSKSADSLLEELRNPNLDVRWRAGEYLANELQDDCEKEKPRYAIDVKFALDLTEELRKALDEESEMHLRIGRKTKEETPKEYRALESLQDLIRFLCGSLGFFDVPVSAPVLCELALRETSVDNQVLKERRNLAIMALAHLGDNVKYFRRQPEKKQHEMLDDLERRAEGGADRSKWARAALQFLRNHESMGVDAALAQCATSADPYVRKISALALAFWDGLEGDAALLHLTHDDGHGAASDQQRLYQKEISYQAVGSFALRGSKLFDENPSWFLVLAEMLDEQSLREQFQSSADGKVEVDEELVRGTIENAVRALVRLHKKRPELDLSRFQQPLEKVSQTSTRSLKSLKGVVDEARKSLSETSQ